MKQRLKMKDLEEVTGVGRETIRYYIREGLLPEPERPGRNVAYYDESFVRRINLIKELQHKRFLPLHVIRSIVGAAAKPSSDEIKTLLELDGKLFPPVASAPEPAPERLGAVAKRTGLKPAEIRRFAGVGAFEIEARSGTEWLDETAARIVEVLAKMRRAGFTEARGFGPEKYRTYVEVVRWLAREDLRLFTEGVTGKVSADEAARMAEAGINHVNQLLALMRKATLLRYISRGRAGTDLFSPAAAAESRTAQRRNTSVPAQRAARRASSQA